MMTSETQRAYRVFTIAYVVLLALGFVVFLAGFAGALTDEAVRVPVAWDEGLEKAFIALAQVFPTAALLPLVVFRWWLIPIGIGMYGIVIALVLWARNWRARAQLVLALVLVVAGPASYFGATWLLGYMLVSSLFGSTGR